MLGVEFNWSGLMGRAKLSMRLGNLFFFFARIDAFEWGAGGFGNLISLGLPKLTDSIASFRRL